MGAGCLSASNTDVAVHGQGIFNMARSTLTTLLTLAQVGTLIAIFDQQGSTNAERKTSAMAVLAVN